MRLPKKIVLIIYAILSISCDCDNITRSESGKWVSEIPFIINHVDIELPHDNRIYESENILTFSDASSDNVKIEFSQKAEQALEEILTTFGINSPSVLGITNQETKITIYTNKYSSCSQLAFPYGFVLYGEDSEKVNNWPLEMKIRYYNQVKHEMVHVVQFLFGVLPNNSDRSKEPDKWFNEGLAEYISEGFFIPIKTKQGLDKWLKQNGSVNPISIHKWSDLNISVSDVGQYYPMFGLAVEYLLDKDGLGRSIDDVKNMFYALSQNQSTFAKEFENNFGLSLQEYESTYFERIDKYLD